MPVSARARVESVIAKIAADLMNEARAAARNDVLSKKEAAGLKPGLLKDADAKLRLQRGKRVRPEEAASVAIAVVRDSIGRVNDKGPSLLSQGEIKALADVNPEVAARAAKAYELITGKRLGSSPSQQLPHDGRVAVVDALGIPDRIEIKDVRAKDGGYSFDVESSAYRGAAFAREVDGRFIAAPKSFSAAEFARVKSASLDFFDRTFSAFMRQWGASDEEIAATRAAFEPRHAIFADEDDPFAGRYPLVFSVVNVSGSDHGVYAGLDPSTGGVEVIAQN